MLELTLYVSIAISAYLGYVVTIQNLLLAKAVIETLKVPPFADSLRLFTFWNEHHPRCITPDASPPVHHQRKGDQRLESV